MPKLIAITLVSILLASAAPSAFSQTPDKPQRVNLVLCADALIGADENLTIGEVKTLADQGRLQRLDSTYLVMPLSGYVIWLRFRIADCGIDLTGREEWLLDLGHSLYSEIDLYLPPRPEPVNILRQARYKILNIPDGTLGDQEIFLRLKCHIPIIAALTLITHKAYDRGEWMDFMTFGIIYGITLGILFFNLYLFISIRDRAYLYFVIYLVSNLIQEFALFGHLGLFAGIVLEDELVVQRFFSGLAFIAVALFNRAFLDLKSSAPKLDKAMILLGVLGLLISVLVMIVGVDATSNLAILTQLFATIISATAGIVRFRHGFRPAIFFIWSWMIAGSITVIYLLMFTGFNIPIDPFVIERSIGFTVAFIAILLSFAQGDRIKELQEKEIIYKTRERKLQKLSITDQLTGLFNKRWFNIKLDTEIKEARKKGYPISLLLIDVDNFKKINDMYGHPAGDTVLEILGIIVREKVRSEDVPCRYGGEEFALILPGADGKIAKGIAERIREAFMNYPFEPSPGNLVNITLSVGLSVLHEDEDGDSFLSRTDQALYKAKSMGRNQTIIAKAPLSH